MTAARLVRTARREAGLTQADLAARAGVPQSTIARLESGGSNPTVRTLERVLHAAGRRLEASRIASSGVDETHVARNLALTPAERLVAFRRAYANVRETVSTARPADGRVA
jgi:transcriptional regulator with XRE-family HTH domain